MDNIKPTIVADYIIAFSNEVGEALTHLKIQKIVYYAQAWYLANYDEPLFAEDFQAWVHGPVLRSLYDELQRVYPNTIISKQISKEDFADIDKGILNFLDEICTVYMPYGGYELELMTHNEEPWKEARGSLGSTDNSENKISKETMKKYYSSLIG